MWKSTNFGRYLLRDYLSPSLKQVVAGAYPCSFTEAIPLCFTPNGLGGSLSGPIFLPRLNKLWAESNQSYLELILHGVCGSVRS
jgi:hypothetical protein